MGVGEMVENLMGILMILIPALVKLSSVFGHTEQEGAVNHSI